VVRRAALLAAAALAAWAPGARAVDVSWSADGRVGANGWYVSDVWILWNLTNVVGPPYPSCTPVHLTSDTPGAELTCVATDSTGTTSKTTTPIKVDQTPPAVRVAPERPPDANGWFTRPVQVGWTATDAGSGVAACTSIAYAGPDGKGVTLTGSCRDRAGNASAAVPFVFDYDATPPTVANLRVRATATTATLAWDATGATTVTLIRASAHAPARQRMVYEGTGASFTDKGLTKGRDYTYILRAVDQAGNVATTSINVTPRSTASSNRLLAPRANATVHRPPLLRWREVEKASYYNVQVFRNGRKVLSAWPSKPRYQLKPAWRYNGHRQRLVAGTYDWYLWAGYGKRAARHYGRLLGKRSFTVR
jgi:hypothetical protein